MKLDCKQGLVIVLFISLISLTCADKSNKYSKKANGQEAEKYEPDFRYVKTDNL